MKYDIIIVLCPERKNPDGKFPDFQDGKYLGGQVRMDAAKEIYTTNRNATFIVVGGYNKNSEESQKTDDMEDFLKQNCPGINIVVVKSLPCTRHNLIAIFNTWKKELGRLEMLMDKKIGLLTNFYHLPRALKFWGELANMQEFKGILVPLPVSAESVIILPANINNLYGRFVEYLLRLDGERQGLKDIEEENYKDECLHKKREFFKDVIKKYSDILLTEEEKINRK